MDSQDNLTVGACIAGLLAFGNRAIPFQLFVTRWGHPVSENVPGFWRKKVRERYTGPQDVPRTALGIRDKFITITESLLLIQKQLASPNLSIDVDALMTALIGCVRTYAEFERLHVLSSQKEETRIPGAAWSWSFTSSPMEKMLISLEYYFGVLHFTVSKMKSDSLRAIPVEQPGASESEPEPKQIAPNHPSLSEVSLPMKLTEIRNKHWYILDIKGKGKPNNANESTSKYPFPMTVGTTGLPPSKLLGTNCHSWPTDPKVQSQVNLRIENDLEIQNNERRKERDIMLMGDYDTIPFALRDMRKAHHIERLESSTKNLRHEVFNYLLQHLELVVREIDKTYWDNTRDVKTNVWAILVCLQEELQPGEQIPRRLLPAFENLWEDGEIKTAVSNRSELLFQDFEYFFQDISRIFGKDYTPSPNDLQQVDPEFPTRIWKNRITTAGINSITYNLVYLRSPSCGGRKWRQMQHLVEDVTAILYLVDLNKYDEAFLDESTETPVHHSLQFFASIASAPLFQKCENVLFFTNIDEFRKKVESGSAPIKKFFPSFDGFYEDGETGLQFFARLFGAEHKTEGRILSTEYTYPNDPKILEKLDQCVNCSLAERREWRKEQPQQQSQS